MVTVIPMHKTHTHTHKYKYYSTKKGGENGERRIRNKWYSREREVETHIHINSTQIVKLVCKSISFIGSSCNFCGIDRVTAVCISSLNTSLPFGISF